MTLPVQRSWFTVSRLRPDLYRITEPRCHRLFRANCYLLLGLRRNLLIDSGMGVAALRPIVESLSRAPLAIFTTHSHADHIGSHSEFPEHDILVHPAEADALCRPGTRGLRFPKMSPQSAQMLRRAGIAVTELVVDAVPDDDYDIDAHMRRPVKPTSFVDEGSVVELGDRRLEVLHLPGHSSGSVALFEAETGSLFSGDAIYDGVIDDTGPDASVPAYFATMERLKRLPVQTVFGGHNDPMTRGRMIAVIDGYMASRTGRGG
ncbi:MBL fold metallo-hydrolase [Bosea sp. (in: a-proteobacteria)]|uniref:MBL fold metallo-hydrolase n=1 Tax=Bosea sp. (in: a-proteobacteria) TaxID=1871050 RepID=UPI0026331D27|nr:MBL fold metallo-hydrolase [Bosea sp. (in: a-proteobacteria)]MCO5091308.1 MBL fold metallo-hydrolase [Bosea sp. (in: a-proteobacteria)]